MLSELVTLSTTAQRTKVLLIATGVSLLPVGRHFLATVNSALNMEVLLPVFIDLYGIPDDHSLGCALADVYSCVFQVGCSGTLEIGLS